MKFLETYVLLFTSDANDFEKSITEGNLSSHLFGLGRLHNSIWPFNIYICRYDIFEFLLLFPCLSFQVSLVSFIGWMGSKWVWSGLWFYTLYFWVAWIIEVTIDVVVYAHALLIHAHISIRKKGFEFESFKSKLICLFLCFYLFIYFFWGVVWLSYTGSGRSFNISWVAGGHPVLDPASLMADANRFIGVLLTLLQSSSGLSGCLTITVVNWWVLTL